MMMENKILLVETDSESFAFEKVDFVHVSEEGALVLYNRVETERTVVTNGLFRNTSKTETSVDLTVVAIFADGCWKNYRNAEYLAREARASVERVQPYVPK